MPRVLPSGVVKMADRMFSGWVAKPESVPQIGSAEIPPLSALARLAEAVPADLLILPPSDYAGLVAAVGFLHSLGDAFSHHSAVSLHLPGYDRNPIALIRHAMALCPDEAAAAGTTALTFIGDDDLRDSIRGDLSAANSNLSGGEWKGATVLAGSAVEALLLWGLQECQSRAPEAIRASLDALRKDGILKKLGDNLEDRDWSLHEYVEVAAHLKLVTAATATLVRLTKDFRNLIHPGRAARLKQACDRSTALAALAAAEGVLSDLEGAVSRTGG